MTGTALVTGGQQGIGLGIAKALHAAGWRVALMSERGADDPAVRDALVAMPGAVHVTHDLARIEGVGAAMDALEAALGPVTTLVSNAGVPPMTRGDLLDMTPESFDRCMEINLRGAFFLIQECARRMLRLPADPYRSIQVVTSVSAEIVSPDRTEYCISKAGAAMMVKALAARLAPEGIGVFEIRPGIIRTPMTAPVADRYDTRITGGLVPAGRWGEPADIGRIAVPLARGDFDFATGAVIPVDGGLSIHRL
ncbi:3-ketoacyl-ACP reductase [Roseibacterium sp. SDUM158016]|uniref:3-ketoacyl-ACP reductase n=1 Tax=Roseicyclus sediminis TaxID=2980997 RepID=UPI0021D2557F|nr:3-ketoacyl-ACP reductase [Roseibacterium sp. SDUM158016]MCU4651396.1 3-ketoacyl-ACP reductase [Roseibacterium sp. SDUM158016]